MRMDLLTLTPDDLITLSNRGTVKRAQHDLETLTADITEDANGALIIRWSDGNICTFPAEIPLARSLCSCSAIGVCRHLIQSVLVYQQHAAIYQPSPQPAVVSWNPGTIS